MSKDAETEESFELHRVVLGQVRYEREDRGFETPCWIWRMWVEPTGYAYSKPLGGRAHRGLYKRLRRDPGRDVCLHHRCDQKDCVNPWHLEEMTYAEHQRLHNLGRKMNLSEAERRRRREHGRKMGKKMGGKQLYTKKDRSEVQKKRHADMTPEEKTKWRRSISEGRKKRAK